jgi:N-acetylmuramoyl-L-alanine amidase
MSGNEVEIGTGESIPSIAKSNGFFWKTIWEHPKNAALKAKRESPNILYQGDVVFVPDKEVEEFPCATNERHDFKLKGDPVKFVLQLKRMGKPRKNEDYLLKIDGRVIEGKTDGDGKLEAFVPGNAKSGELVLKKGQEKYQLRLSRLDPVDTVTGVQQRLNNLGFSCGSENGELTPKTKKAIRNFQAKHGLDVSGEPDAATQGKLKELIP